MRQLRSQEAELKRAIEQLGKLAHSGTDRPRVIDQAVELRNKGVPLRVLAKCCGVAV
jgi:predicted component of type VI protein secretion system